MLRIVFRTIPSKVAFRVQKIEELRLITFTRRYATEKQDKTKICPPPKPKKKSSSGLAITLGAIVLVGGATIYYAKQNPEFREQLVEIVPVADDIISFVFREPGRSGFKNPFGPLIASILNKNKKGEPQDKSQINPPAKDYKAPGPVIAKLEQEEQEECYAEIRLEKKDDEETEVVIAGDPKPAVTELPETHPKNLEELEAAICAAATEAVNSYEEAIYHQKLYNQEIETIVEENVDSIKPTTWEKVKQRTKEKNDSIKLAETRARQARRDITKLKSLVDSEEFQASPGEKALIKNNMNKMQDDIDKAVAELEKEKRVGKVTERYWQRVETARKHFGDELESLFPDIDVSQKNMKINPEELDLFLLHVYATVLFYQKELAKLETVGREKIKQAIDNAKTGKGPGALTPGEVCELLEQEKRKLTLCFQQQCLKLRKEIEDEMREQMKRQSQAFADHLEEALRTREMEVEKELARKFDEKLEEERCKFKMQMAAMVGRLRGLDHAMRAKRESDSTARQAQILWSACQSLTRALRAGCPGLSWKEQIRPLEPEINAVKKAAGDDDSLVTAVISALPKEAKNRGVFPEDALRERFLRVEKVARNVALVPEGGASLPVHILSFIQGFLMLKAASPIPQAELNDKETDFSKLNTNEILQRARYWLDRGNFEQALKYMNLLTGAPRCVAKQWMNETRILLETQQAANTLMAHAASSGLKYL